MMAKKRGWAAGWILNEKNGVRCSQCSRKLCEEKKERGGREKRWGIILALGPELVSVSVHCRLRTGPDKPLHG